MLLFLNIILFLVGIALVVGKENQIFTILGFEFIIQAAISNFIAFRHQYVPNGEIQVAVVFFIVVSICELVLYLALMLQVLPTKHPGPKKLAP